MNLYGLTSLLKKSAPLNKVIEILERGENAVFEGLTGSAKTSHLASVLDSLQKGALIVTYSHEEAIRIVEEIKLFYPKPDEVFLFPAPDIIPFEKASPSRELVSERLNILDRWIEGKKRSIVVAPLKAVMYKTLPRKVLESSMISLKKGETVDRDEIIVKLDWLGYKRMDIVGERGEISVRGGIVDVFSSSYLNPIRIEFLGDTIESIRFFDVLLQRSIEEASEVKILPARELVITPEAAKRVERLRSEGEDFERLANKEYFDGIEYYLPFIYENGETPLDFLPEDTLLVFDEPMQLEIASDRLMDEADEVRKSDKKLRKVEPPSHLYTQFKDIKKNKMQLLELSSIGLEGKSSIQASLSHPGYYLRKIDGMIRDLGAQALPSSGQAEAKEKVLIVSRQGMRLRDLFEDEGVEVSYVENLDTEPGSGITIVSKELGGGFALPELKLRLLTDTEIFGERMLRGEFRIVAKEGVDQSLLVELNPGDFVVHQNHGIGIYRGLQKLDIEGAEQEYLLVEYAEEDKLYVPLSQMGLISKYSSGGDFTPKISRLGGREWERTRESAKKSVKDLTEDLLKLYAIRKKEKGYAFPPDHLWQIELESSFPFEETPDQVEAIRSVKEQMESDMPMDILVCGDVGYGKTEVALRAAFKAITAGKQVAFLVPTTILAQQHFSNFKERFSPFPFIVEMLSRFKSKKEQKEIIKDIETGGVDIVIGTHRLLQKDIKFKDLGLVIIDEEQRFGVLHKERLKDLKKTVDVLTLTATPIPRTLYLSLAGARDMSMINTPPLDRSPVRTYVLPFSDPVIREAIFREIERNGQVYFVHNTIEDIELIARKVERLVPHAKIAVAHGRMDERELSETMTDFMQRKFDILVCTTIIESGLDIPNVNTIIIDGAPNFGLADLYQLRGRVGRSVVHAYAYLLYHPEEVLTEKALRRLQAIKEFTALGSGYRLALRDLEIRGAGNILGAEQHGHVMAVGFDMYCQLLDEAVKRVKGIKEVPSQEVLIDLKLNAYIPKDYVSDERQRIAIYRRMAYILRKEEIEDTRKELKDRFGKIPHPLNVLFKLLYLKVSAKEAGIKSIEEEDGTLKFNFVEFKKGNVEKVTSRYRKTSSLFGKILTLKVPELSREKRFELVSEIVDKLK
ncbi:MAG: transcription-repair coupling factor [Candidatus Saganbacteria bacterium]|nr:transcription-repair coupling factor [Candidatus Saganbacteria bacterium]